MPTIDEFESQFRAAARERYVWRPLDLRRAALFSDLPAAASKAWLGQVQAFLGPLAQRLEWTVFSQRQCDTVGEVLSAVAELDPHLVVTFRNVHSSAREWPYSLSDLVEVLTQVADAPVLLLPRPDPEGTWRSPRTGTHSVMALADHLSGDRRLVDLAAGFAASGATLWLTHVEDDSVFERYMDVIGKIPQIDTDVARKRILEALLREPRQWIDSIVEELGRQGSTLTVMPRVTLGHRLKTFRALLAEHDVDLLVLNTKDKDQLAMHGLSYPLAVELRQTPLLLL